MIFRTVILGSTKNSGARSRMGQPVHRNCLHCGGDFKMEYRRRNVKRDFCSVSCAASNSANQRRANAKRVTIECTHCKEGFEMLYSQTHGHRKESRKFCSRACKNESSKIAVPHFDCVQCGKNMARTKTNKKNGAGYNYSQKYCSKECQSDSMRKEFHIDKNGYKILHLLGRGDVPEHRYVMEKIVGRILFKDETVHHRNGLRSDNRPSNLELWSSRHGKGQRVSEKVQWCIEFLKDYADELSAEGYQLIEKTNNVISLSDYIVGAMSDVA